MAKDIAEIVAALIDFYTPEEIDEWLAAPHPHLGGRSASALICEGRQVEVMAAVKHLQEGVYL